MELDVIDLVFKLLSLVAIPALGWAWKSHTALMKLEVEFEHVKVQVKEMEPHKTDIAMIKQSLTYMSEKLDEIKTLISSPR
jgi:hypothetical protein